MVVDVKLLSLKLNGRNPFSFFRQVHSFREIISCTSNWFLHYIFLYPDSLKLRVFHVYNLQMFALRTYSFLADSYRATNVGPVLRNAFWPFFFLLLFPFAYLRAMNL